MFSEVCSGCNKSVSSCSCGIKVANHEMGPMIKCFYYKPSRESYVGNRVIFALKHTDDKRIAKMLARELATSLDNVLKSEGSVSDECVFTFVPRRKSAIFKDGFDQGLRLAKYSARYCGSGYKFRRLFIRSNSREQKKLKLGGRISNLEASLALRPLAKRALAGKTVVLVDDVVTSGATMRAAEKLLLSLGAKQVIFACVARTLSDK